MPEVNSQAPDFKLHRDKTETVQLSDLRGDKVVIAFFPAAFTGVCEKELCTFRDGMASFNDLGAKVLAISTDGPFANGEFAKKNDLTFPVLCDLGATVTRSYGVADENWLGIPGYTVAKRSVFIVDGDGKITWKWVAPNPGVEPDYDAVKAALA